MVKRSLVCFTKTFFLVSIGEKLRSKNIIQKDVFVNKIIN